MAHLDPGLARDNALLSQPSLSPTALTRFTASSQSSLPDIVARYAGNSHADSTVRAYRADLEHFARWGGSIPADPVQVATYIAEHAGQLSVATLRRRLVTLSKIHKARALANPVPSDLVKATLVGIARAHGTAQMQAKPLLREDLERLLASTSNSLQGIRDRALLLIGFYGAFRRSELVSIDRTHLAQVPHGLVIHVPRSKTDQLGVGRHIGIAKTSGWCPVAALCKWIEQANIVEGPVFRPMDRRHRVSSQRLSGEAVSLVIKRCAAAADFEPEGLSGHSLRAGYVTAAALDGVPTWRIRRQTGHTSDATLARYIRIAADTNHTTGRGNW